MIYAYAVLHFTDRQGLITIHLSAMQLRVQPMLETCADDVQNRFAIWPLTIADAADNRSCDFSYFELFLNQTPCNHGQ